MITRSKLIYIAILVLAGVLTFLKIPVASSQGVTITAARVEGALPLDDLQAAVWDEATAVSVPLSAQIITRPSLTQSNVRAVDVRALHNNEQISFMVEWDDQTMNDTAVRVQDFSDAVAIQFPLAEGAQPFFCMGQQGGNVNIWHWKADSQIDMNSWQDVDTVYPNMYVDGYTFTDTDGNEIATVEDYTDPNYLPAYAADNLIADFNRLSPVEDIIAGGFSTLTSQSLEGQNVKGFGVWEDGKWHVIFSRALDSAESEDILFSPGKVYSIAFAAWDGENEERDGQKSTSQWVSLQLEQAVPQEILAEEPIPVPSGYPLFFWILIGGLVLFLLISVIISFKLPE